MKVKNILGISNAKTSKGEALGYLTGILYLAPQKSVNGVNLCPKATEACIKSCLYTAGRGKFNNVKQARINKTLLFRDHREYFYACLIYSIEKTIKQAKRKGLIPCIRLNGTSDITWENLKIKDEKNIFELFPDVQFYDYTAILNRKAIRLKTWKNYHLTFSRKDTRENWIDANEAMKLGVNVAIVYHDINKALKKKAINGDLHDLRFLDKKGGKIVALKAKGEAKKDVSGFVL